jgi:uncharacterized protein (DUF1697 family)
MAAFAIFLRGVNVGGRCIVKMSELKTLLHRNGFANVQTFLNSGNVTLTSALHPEEIKEKIAGILGKKYPFSVDFIVKTAQEMQAVISRDPFRREGGLDGSKKCIAFLSAPPLKELLSLVNEDGNIVEKYRIVGDLIYIYYHNGIGRSYFSNSYIEKRLRVTSTVRNMNTVEKIAEMLGKPF